MGSKLGTILSLLIYFMAALFSVDLINISLFVSSIDSACANASVLLSKHGGIAAIDKVNEYFEKTLGEYTLEIVDSSSSVGDFFIYKVSKPYQMIFLQEEINITIIRSAYIGAYQS